MNYIIVQKSALRTMRRRTVTYSTHVDSQSSGLPECFNEQRHVLFASVVRQNRLRRITRQLVASSILPTANSSPDAAAAAANAV